MAALADTCGLNQSLNAVGTGAEGSFLQGPLVAARRALVMGTAVKSRRIMWSSSSLFELCILWYYCFCLLDFFGRIFLLEGMLMGCGISFPFVVSRATDYIDAAAQLPAASASKRRQQQAKPVLALARCAERSVLRQGWNVKCEMPGGYVEQTDGVRQPQSALHERRLASTEEQHSQHG